MITLGTDPEFFITKGGAPLAVCGLIGGTKGAALDIGEGTAIQEDNVMVEWNTTPASSPEAFAERVFLGFIRVMDFVRTKVPGVEPALAPVMEFPASQLTSPQAQMFGCAPDFDAYQRGAPCPILTPAKFVTPKGAYRFAGGHVHIGYGNPNEVPDYVVAALCDAYIGLESIIMGDKQGKRREFYGAPGRYRPTAYGIEYRVLSNFWTADMDRAHRIGVCARRVGQIVERCDVADVQSMFKSTPWDAVRSAISREDGIAAKKLRNYLSTQFKGL